MAQKRRKERKIKEDKYLSVGNEKKKGRAANQ